MTRTRVHSLQFGGQGVGIGAFIGVIETGRREPGQTVRKGRQQEIMYRISELARRFGLSRSTLLYYDRIGLMRPSHRTAAGYRVYTSEDEQRLEAICNYRHTDMVLFPPKELTAGV